MTIYEQVLVRITEFEKKKRNLQHLINLLKSNPSDINIKKYLKELDNLIKSL